MARLIKFVLAGSIVGALVGWLKRNPEVETTIKSRVTTLSAEVARSRQPTSSQRPPEPVRAPEPAQDPTPTEGSVGQDSQPEPVGAPELHIVADPEPEAQPSSKPEVAEDHLPENEASPAGEHHHEATYAELTPEATEAEPNVISEPKWVQPIDGECPPTHTLKARFSTGRYHRPGDRGYDKVIPDCCYATEEDGQADGFSKARW